MAAALGITTSATAQTAPAGYIEVPDYVEHFSSTSVANSRVNAPTDPWGWATLYGDQVNGTSTYKMDYTTIDSGKEGYAIGTTTSSWIRKNWSTNEVANLYDYVITPQVKGNIKFFLKRYSTSDSYKPKLQIYKMHRQDDGTFTTDTLTDRIDSYDIDLTTLLPNTSEWVEQSLSVGGDYQYIGLRMQSLYIDEFSASSAIIPIKRDLTLGNITFVGGTSIKANADNTISLTIQIPVKNSGNVDLTAANAGNDYTISMVRNISSSQSDVMATVTLPDLKAGEEKTVEISVDSYPIPSDISPNSYGEIRFRVDCVEHFTGKETVKTGSWLDITPYVSILNITYDKKSPYNGAVTDTQVDPSKAINYGSFVGERTISFRLRNRGSAPVEFTSIDKPEWVSLVDLPSSIPAGSEPVTVGVKISGEPGLKEGSIKFNTNGSPLVDEISLYGEVIGTDEYFADFEDADAFNEWYLPNPSADWKIADYTSTERENSESYYPIEYGFNGKRLEHGSRPDDLQYIYSPKLAFEEGEKISFLAAKKTNNGSDIIISVMYSPDRANWTSLGTITTTNENPDLQFFTATSYGSTIGQNVMKSFSFEIPQGEYYIALGARYVLIDNFHGGKLVDTDYDIVTVSSSTGKTTMVNNPLTYSATFKNLTSDAIPAEAQTVELIAGDEVVATAQAQDLDGYATVTYDFSYVPHTAGPTDIYARISIGDYSVSSPTATVDIEEESALVKTTIGKQSDTSSFIPLSLNYNNSRSEIVYYPEQLDALDGTAITRISFPYYKTDAHVSERVRIWMANSDNATVPTTFAGSTDVADMTLVYDKAAYEFAAGGSKDLLVDMVFTLDETFDYEPGKNLRIVIESLGTNYTSTYFAIDKSDSNHKTFYYRNDTRSTYEEGKSTQYGATAGFPVIDFFTEKEVPEVSGTVKDEEGNAIMGASVKALATAGDVFYETETDADGAWSMTIFQPELSYTLTVSAEGYATNSGTPLSMEGVNDITLSEKEEVVPAPVKGDYTAEKNAARTGYDVTVTWELEPDETTSIPCDTVEYTFDVHHNGVFHGNTAGLSYTIPDLPQGQHEIWVITKSVSSGKMSEPLVITLLLDDPTGVGIIGVDEVDSRYYDLNGIEVDPATATPGLYIKVTPKATVKVLKR